MNCAICGEEMEIVGLTMAEEHSFFGTTQLGQRLCCSAHGVAFVTYFEMDAGLTEVRPYMAF